MTYQELLKEMLSGTNHILLASRGGSGKTHLINQYRNASIIPGTDSVLYTTLIQKKTIMVAPSGLASSHIDGSTIHSIFGFKPSIITGEDASDSHCDFQLLSNIDTLIIDEISMVRADVLNGIDIRLKQAKQNDHPFGGVKLIMVGDPYQLQPVVQEEDKEFLKQITGIDEKGFYFFQSTAFKKTEFLKNLVVYSLEGSFRHKTDPVFSELLDRVRIGNQTEKDVKIISQRFKPGLRTSYQVICTTNKSVELTNLHAKIELQSTGYFIDPLIYPESMKNHSMVLKHHANSRLELILGSRVLVTMNLKRCYNGSTGVIQKIDTSDGRIPVTVHVLLDDGHLVEIGRENFNIYRPKWDEKKKRITVAPIARINNFPLMSSYAMTIHRAQGMTMSKVAINFGSGSFAYGQTYVALSRVRRLEDLFLVSQGITSDDIKVSYEVKEFMESISNLIIEVR